MESIEKKMNKNSKEKNDQKKWWPKISKKIKYRLKKCLIRYWKEIRFGLKKRGIFFSRNQNA